MTIFELMLLNQKVITDFQEKIKKKLVFPPITIPEFPRTKKGDTDYKRYMRMTQEDRDDIIVKAFDGYVDELSEFIEVHQEKLDDGLPRIKMPMYVPVFGQTLAEWRDEVRKVDQQGLFKVMRRNPKLQRNRNAKTKKNMVDIVQTTANGMINRVNLSRWQKAPEYDRVISKAVIDGHTTPLCMSLNNKVWKKNDPAINVPPRHINCRSWLEPVESGQIVDKRKPEEVFNNLSIKKQQRIAGIQGRKMINSGKYKMSDIVNKITGERLTVKKLREMEE